MERRHGGSSRPSRPAERAGFKALVTEAFESLPPRILSMLENVGVVVEDWPDPEDLDEMDLLSDEVLYGLYVGIPRTQRGAGYGMVVPDRIVIYRRPLQRDFPTKTALREQIRRTLLHEIGHALGMDHDRLEEAGLD